MSDHDHGPTAALLDKVHCLTCGDDHIATIPAVTFRCDSCGFGCWGHSVAAAHADTYRDHIVFPLHHRTVCYHVHTIRGTSGEALPALADLVEAVGLHGRGNGFAYHGGPMTYTCFRCREVWPCPTARALDALAAALGVTQ